MTNCAPNSKGDAKKETLAKKAAAVYSKSMPSKKSAKK